MTTGARRRLADQLAATLTASGAPEPRPRATRPSPKPAAGDPPRLSAGEMIQHDEGIRPLGAGGMGEVHLARDTRLGRLVALKFLLHVGPDASARFVAEARATAQVGHENIVTLYDIAEHKGVPYMALEYIRGRTLAEWMSSRADAGSPERRPGLPPARAVELMLPVARALMCAHEAGVVHRDLKPLVPRARIAPGRSRAAPRPQRSQAVVGDRVWPAHTCPPAPPRHARRPGPRRSRAVPAPRARGSANVWRGESAGRASLYAGWRRP